MEWNVKKKEKIDSLSRVESVDIIRSSGCGSDWVLSEAEHCVKVILEALKRGEDSFQHQTSDVQTRLKDLWHGTTQTLSCLTCLIVALKAPKMAAAPPQSLFIPGMVV